MKLTEAIVKIINMDGVNQKIDSKPNLDMLDYYWFLASLADTKDKGYRLEILDDATGSYKYYRIYEVNVSDEELYKLELSLLPEDDESSKEEMLLEIDKVNDTRIIGGYKYYVITPDGKYRFLVCTRKE